MTELYSSYSVLKHFIFSIIRFLIVTFRDIQWWLDGTWLLYKPYQTSAHVQKIVWRSRKSQFECIHPKHFFGSHERFDSPKIVLDDDVILTCVTQTEAFFLQLKHPIWQYTADKAPFCWITLFQEAVNTISMPLSSLHRLAEEIGSIQTPSLIISNQGRCGSTLLCKLSHLSHRRTLALSEPDALVSLQDLIQYKDKMGAEFERTIRSSVRLIFKPVTDADAIVIKVRLTAMRVIKYVGVVCPEVKHVYMQRSDLLKTVQSWQTAFMSDERGKLLSFLGKYHMLNLVLPHFFNFSKESSYVYRQGMKMLNLKNPFETLILAWADSVSAYKTCCQMITFHIIIYEELLANPEKELRKFFDLLGIEPKNLTEALAKGFNGDAQNGTPLSKKVTSTRHAVEYTPEIKKRVDTYLDAIGLPHLD